ncbi:MAG: hypothetical protein Q4Q53_06640 [Methanocorpusculum sp.]|nr:hypothetical protein [Methanocorpusculum sp.]
MSRRRSTSTIKSKSNAKLYIFAIGLVAVVVAVGGAFAVYATGQELNNIGADSGVGVMASVSGNDLIIKLIDGGRLSLLRGIKITISGVSLSDDYSYSDIGSGQSEVLFKDVAYGIIGSKGVVVKGFFNDGKTAALLASNVYFG